jgi:hypothetical protein
VKAKFFKLDAGALGRIERLVPARPAFQPLDGTEAAYLVGMISGWLHPELAPLAETFLERGIKGEQEALVIARDFLP